mmetsp:Transcript_31004/g.66009  ORF Transcript_31004/g.66009 Transcript_31004/m.66009 type:complete len:212 (-) Transcript_31004:370-1005(-)
MQRSVITLIHTTSTNPLPSTCIMCRNFHLICLGYLHLLLIIFIQQRNNIRFNIHWLHPMTVRFNCTTLSIYQILVKVPFYSIIGVFLTQLKDHIGRQRRSRKEGEMHLGEVGPYVLQNFLVGVLLLMKIIGGKCQHIESPRCIFIAEECQLFVVGLGQTSFACDVDNKAYSSRIFHELLPITVDILHFSSVNGIRRQDSILLCHETFSMQQ